eukprot:gene19408-23240_t
MNLMVKESRIDGAGKGLFAKRSITTTINSRRNPSTKKVLVFPKGTKILEYTGVKVTTDYVKEEKANGRVFKYLLDFRNGTIINAEDSLISSVARFINHQSNEQRINVNFNKNGWVVAHRNIFSNQELYADYGDSYMKK